MEAIKGQSYNLGLPFFVGGDYVSPTNNQVTYTIYDNSGQPIVNYTNIVAYVSGNYFSLNVPSSLNTIASELEFERRTVLMQYDYLGNNYKVQKNYMITDFYPISVTFEKVLSYLGLKEGEIFPEDLEITLALFDIKLALGKDLFNSHLISGDYNNILLNDAIKYQTANRLLASIEFRAMQKAGSEGIFFARFATIDFKRLYQRVQSDLSSTLSNLGGFGIGAFDVLTLSNPIDIFTG